MNLNKLTKAELINKFKKIESRIDSKNNNQSIFNRIIDLITSFKNILIKLTFISFILKILRKYSLFRKI
jgi:hypothetical protein